MSEYPIQRYDYYESYQRPIQGITKGHTHSGVKEDVTGKYVLYADHVAEIAALKAEVERLSTQVADIALELGCTEHTSHRHSHGRCIFDCIDRLSSENTRLREALESASLSITELTADMKRGRCADPNCGGSCGIRMRAKNAVVQARAALAEKGLI